MATTRSEPARIRTFGLAPVGLDLHAGRGLWIAMQVCDHLGISRSEDGFLVRLVVGSPNPA